MKIATEFQGRQATRGTGRLKHQKPEAKRRGSRRSRGTETAEAADINEAAHSKVTVHEEPVPTPEASVVNGDSLQLYLREIGQVKLLTPEEEIVLAKRIKRGDKHAREHMIKANLRLVVKIARDYENLGLPLLDLINEGNIGLMKGVERFDPKKGAKLSTYASWWIKQAIKRALANQSKTIRLPVHVVDKVAHIRRAEMRLRETLDREPTDEEVASELGLDARRVRRYRQASRAPVSLDAPLGDDDTERVAEVVADPNAALPSERLVYESDNALVQEILATLPPREREILAMRFGLVDGQERTLEEVGERFGVTRERIRQIQEEALKTIRKTMEKRDQPVEDREPFAVAA
ncbi:MAG TPA: sigma-70 family RNA polymerase sigma factor [Verrucomicrobiae bacterium]|nr:sigma-70 family RNA polymerase sigma factor [Verrucomicrobiae bacterium]